MYAENELSTVQRGDFKQYFIIADDLLNHTTKPPFWELLDTAKSSLGSVPNDVLHEIRRSCNRFEELGRGPFLKFPFHRPCFINRAAMKLANIDAFDDVVNDLVGKGSEFTFIDLCGGPGGFSEYLIMKCRLLHPLVRCTGFGLSLLLPEDSLYSRCNWDLDHLEDPVILKCSIFHMVMPLGTLARLTYPTTQPENSILPSSDLPSNGSIRRSRLYLLPGVSGDGDIYNFNNIDSLFNYVQLALTSPKPTKTPSETHIHIDRIKYVDFVCADGGFETPWNESRNISVNASNVDPTPLDHNAFLASQEFLSLKIFYCQVLAMVKTLRPGGSFLLKLFDCVENPTIRLLLLLSSLFISCKLLKPITSRPANGERYLLCKGFVNLSHGQREEIAIGLMAVINQLLPSHENASACNTDAPAAKCNVEHLNVNCNATGPIGGTNATDACNDVIDQGISLQSPHDEITSVIGKIAEFNSFVGELQLYSLFHMLTQASQCFSVSIDDNLMQQLATFRLSTQMVDFFRANCSDFHDRYDRYDRCSKRVRREHLYDDDMMEQDLDKHQLSAWEENGPLPMCLSDLPGPERLWPHRTKKSIFEEWRLSYMCDGFT